VATSISDVLEAARANIASLTGEDVGLGPPIESKPGLFIFPYKISDDLALRNPAPYPTSAQTDWGFIMNCLLMPSPSNGYAAIGKGLKSLTELRTIVLGESTATINKIDLSEDVLTQIFISAGITHRLAIPFELRWTSSW